MTTKDALIEAFRALCEREGGVELVAEKIGASAEGLGQVLAGVKLPSGQPRGIGPGIQRKLEARYPGWWRQPVETPHQQPRPPLSVALEVLGAELARDMPEEVRADVADAMRKMAERRGAARDQALVLHLLGTAGAIGKRQVAA